MCALPSPALAVEFTSISWIRGVRYEIKVTQEDIDKGGGGTVVVKDKDKNENYVTEPKGVPFAQMLAKAEAEAIAILGEEYTGKEPRWVFASAERVECGEDGAEGYYYQFSYERRRSFPKVGDQETNLALYVMMDGTLLKPVKVEEEK